MAKKYLDEAGAAYLVRKILDLLNLKVDIEEGKGLSEEDFTALLKAKLDELDNYSLPTATSQELGGIKVGSGLNIDQNGILSATGGGESIDIEDMTEADIDALFVIE